MGVVLSEPTPEQRAAIAQYRDEGRIAEYGAEYVEHEKAAGRLPGGCSWVSEWVAMTFGWNENGGCYIEPATGGHIAHLWNELPDGRIFDGTADQFVIRRDGEVGVDPDGIRIVPGNDPRYDATCERPVGHEIG